MQLNAKVATLLRNDPAAWIAVVGDVNDIPESPPFLALTQPGDGFALIDVHAGLPRSQRSTLLRQSSHQAVDTLHPVDYILISPGLAGHLVPEAVGHPAPSDIKASDHIPMTASFDIPSVKY